MTNQLPGEPEPRLNQVPHRELDTESSEPSDVSMLQKVFWCVLFAAGASFFYALKIESSLFRAAALQLCLCGVAVWAAMDAAKIRRRLGASRDEDAVALNREAAAIHYLYVAAPLVAILVLAGLSMIGQLVEVSLPRSQQQVIGGAIIAVLAASLWTVFARALKLHVHPTTQQGSPRLPELLAVRAALSESRLAALLTGGTLMAATVYPPIEGWFAWGLSLWVIAVASEQLIYVFAGWFRPIKAHETFTSPVNSILLEIFLSSTNPVGKLFDIAEARFGLSLRSSWTIRFFRRSVFPIAAGCLLVVWLSTCFVVIEPQQAGLEERFGRPQPVRLQPGLHTKLPWPFGVIRRYPAGIVQTMQIGFEEKEAEAVVSEDSGRTLLWTQPHAQEFSLVLGSETELVAVNAIVYFKIAENTKGFLDYALYSANPEVALESLAYRVLMEQTRVATLADLLSRGRDQFAEEVREKLSEYSVTERLGLDVIDVALINLHPPVEVASSYLDVINAGLDSNRAITEAKGEAAKQILEAEQESNGRLAAAKIEAAKRVSLAGQESAEFIAVGEAFTATPDTYRLRIWFEAIEQVLFGRRLFIVDSELPDVILDERSRSINPVLIESTKPPTP
ncbi:FtsH protease regulator HflK [Symmachiella macrocystis]|uniref:FtsH protease regulator HflK n=1 Tax=Symmachiella macrocystis TaxID=2527985 RepID=A0A5C6BJ29_9PLAN|nr:protease modulator HflK [Symmachiella macrocystis]TWU11722.1 FtsH protease regulator HflK [Symmachiella macrocystis]